MAIDWKDMFRRYMAMVVESEGVFFMASDAWTDEEAAALIQLHIAEGATPEDARKIVKGWHAPPAAEVASPTRPALPKGI